MASALQNALRKPRSLVPRAPRHSPAAPPEPSLDAYYNSLFTAFGPQHWWPGKTPFEIVVGAILTQNTSWTNVERVIANLRKARLLTPAAIERAPVQTIERLIRPS